jgi:hypothetical protein
MEAKNLDHDHRDTRGTVENRVRAALKGWKP